MLCGIGDLGRRRHRGLVGVVLAGAQEGTHTFNTHGIIRSWPRTL